MIIRTRRSTTTTLSVLEESSSNYYYIDVDVILDGGNYFKLLSSSCGCSPLQSDSLPSAVAVVVVSLSLFSGTAVNKEGSKILD